MRKSNLLIYILFSIFALGFSGCRDSLRDSSSGGYSPDEHQINGGESMGDLIPVTLNFDAAGLSNPAQTLRASLTKEDENNVTADKVRVLVFNKNTNKFRYEAKVTSVVPNAANNKKEGRVKLLVQNSESGTADIFVMLSGVDRSTPAESDFADKTLDDVMALFTYSVPTDGNWKKTSSATTLPMWGRVEAVVNHSKGAVPTLPTVTLLRSLARVDVGLALSDSPADGGAPLDEVANGLGELKLTSVKFFNVSDKGTWAPTEANYDQASKKVTAPSVFAGAALTILDKSDDIAGKKLLLRSAYLPEALNNPTNATVGPNGTALPEDNITNYLYRPFMVVGIKGADKVHLDRVTFFRIDYLKRSGTEATATYRYLPLLRNHRYKVNITNVGGPGFDSEEDAMKGPAANIMYNVVVWSESEMTNVQYDGQYMLGVSEDHFKFYREGGDLKAKAQTSWPKGLKIMGLPNWIHTKITPADPTKTKPTDEQIITFTIDQTTTQDRSATGYVQAGRMRWNIDVTQTKDINVDIKIFSDPECTKPLQYAEINQFGKDYDINNPNKSIKTGTNTTLSKEEANAIITFYVKTAPQHLEPKVSDDSTGRFIIDKVGNTGGVWKYTATAHDITDNDLEFENYTNSFDFTVKYSNQGLTKNASAKLSLLQKEYNAIPFGDEDLKLNLTDPEDAKSVMYLLDGEKKSFFMKANTEYNLELIKAESVSDFSPHSSVVYPFSRIKETNPQMSGKKVVFTPKNDIVEHPSLFRGKAKFKLTSPTGLFPEKTFEILLTSAIKQPEANTYMIKKGARQGILIPVSRVNTAREYYEQLLRKDSRFLLTRDGQDSSDKLPGTKEDFMLNKLDDDDDYSVTILWTDIHNTQYHTAVERSGLKSLSRIGTGGPNSYIFVEAGEKAGNVLIAIRSNKISGKPILWSWHIWIVNDYPKVYNVSERGDVVPDGTPVSGRKLGVMSLLIGATEEAKTQFSTNLNQIGMQYQWGRKDPFPPAALWRWREYYDGDGRRFDFVKYQKGDDANSGLHNALYAAGITLTMRSSIENPYSIVSHQSFWQLEHFPHAPSSNTYKKKWTFLYPWNHYMAENDGITPRSGQNPESWGGKTVFDPSPYGFRIMTYGESKTLKTAYSKNNLKSPFTPSIYDGSYTKEHPIYRHMFYAACQPNMKDLDSHAARYLVVKSWDTDNNMFRRACGFSIRPVIDAFYFGDRHKEFYTKYLPK